MDVLRPESKSISEQAEEAKVRGIREYPWDTILQISGVLILAVGVALISVAAGLIVLGSLTLAYGIIREIVATSVTMKSSDTEESQDDGIR
jgi:hypothetical protein